MAPRLIAWLDRTFFDLRRQFRWSFLPPLMVYLAAGVSGLTAVVGAFFVKEHLGLSAAFLSGLAFWTGLPWALKLPVGHLVDVVWRYKSFLIHLGAVLIAASLLIMYALISTPERMATMLDVEAWFVLSAILAPCGYVIQDSVADAMSVEAIPRVDDTGAPIPDDEAKALHTTMQTFGRFALISGFAAVALLNILMFEDIGAKSDAETAEIYASIYLYALAIPAISVSGVLLAALLRRRRRAALRGLGWSDDRIAREIDAPAERTRPNPWYFGGGLAFAALSLAIGLSDSAYAQEIVFVGSMAIIVFLMTRLVRDLDPARARTLYGTAIIIFVFRATPLPGPGATWFEIDILGFDQQFLAVLALITSLLTLIGMIVLRPMMATRPITWIVLLLTVVAGLLSLPNIGLFYGLHHWTSALTGGVVDARFIAVIDTAVESPLGQVAMIPMLAWIARNAPPHLKATFFAVMASFTNLALSASSLATRYLNEIFVVTREVRDRETGAVSVAADYAELGPLLVTVALIGVLAPLVAVFLVQRTAFRTTE